MNLRALSAGASMVAVVVAGVALSAATHTIDPGPRLTIDDLQVTGDPAWIHGEQDGQPTVRFTVHNQGSTDVPGYAIEYHWVGDDGETTWLRGTKQNSTDVAGRLRADDSRDHEQAWDLLPHHRGEGTVRVTVTVDPPQGDDPGTQESIGLFVPVHHVAVNVPGEDQTIRPHETRFFRASMTNHGNQEEILRLEIEERRVEPEEVGSDLEEYLQHVDLVVPPGATRNSTLFVDYGFFGEDIPFSVTYDLQVETGYGRILNTTTPDLLGVAGTVPPESPFRLERTDASPLVVPSDGNLTRAFRLTNTGTSDDTYRVTALPATDWEAAADLPGADPPPGEGVRAALEAGLSMQFDLTVRAPEGALQGTPADVILRVVSDRRPTEPVDHAWSFRVQGPAVRIEPTEGWDATTYRGDPAHLMVSVHNDGDRATPEQAEVRLHADSATDPVANATVPSIRPGGTAEVVLDAGNHSVAGPVHLVADWASVPADIHVEALERELFIRDPSVILTPPAPLLGMPGETVGYRAGTHAFVVRNTGDSEETFLARVTTDGGEARLVSDAWFLLAPGGQRIIPIDHHLPDPAGTMVGVNASVHVSIEDRPDLNWTAGVVTGIVDVLPPTLEPGALPALWTTGEALNLTVSVVDDSAVHAVQVDHTDPSGARTVHAMRPDAGGAGPWTHEVVLSLAGNHSFVFIAQDAHGNEASSVTSVVGARPFPPPVVELLALSDGDKVHPSNAFDVRVQDGLPIARVTARALNDTGGTVWERDLEVSDGTARFDFAGTPLGDVTVVVEAVNAAGGHSNQTVSVSVVPRTAAQPDGLDGDGGKTLPVSVVLPALSVALGGVIARRWRTGGGRP